MNHKTRAFSLFELSISLLLVGLLTGGAMTLFNASGRQQCYQETKQTLEQARQAVEQYAMSNGRYPMPARRQVDSRSPNYGRELPFNSTDAVIDSELNRFVITNATDGTVGATMVYGAFPFATVGTSVRLAEDCWGNKLTYVVTKDLTDTTKFDNATDGAFDIKTDVAHTHAQAFLKGAGFAIISHGADGLGAVKVNYSGTTKNWCTYDAANWGKTENCDVTNNVLISRAYSDGKDAAGTYYDDLITFKGKPWVLSSNSNIYCWGNNSFNALGIAPTADSSRPSVVLDGPSDFRSVSTGGNQTTCALTSAGKAYCWGKNSQGQAGIGSTGLVTKPTAVADNHTFVSLSAGGAHICGITPTNEAWCWGRGAEGQLGYSDIGTAPQYKPKQVSGTFASISAGGAHTCALDLSGAAYCWGKNSDGQLGIGVTAQKNSPKPLGLTFAKIVAGDAQTCAIGSDGFAYCWGKNEQGGVYGFLGTGNFVNANFGQPAPVLGGLTFANMAVANMTICGTTTSNKTYCWGTKGTLGNNDFGCTLSACTDSFAPTAVMGGHAFSQISGKTGAFCGLESDGKAWCWGKGAGNVLGKGSSTDSAFPSAVNGGLHFSDISTNQDISCAVAGTPAAFNGGWSDWDQCTGACDGGLGTQTRTCLTGSCTGPSSQSCQNTAPCMVSYRDPPATWTGTCPYGASCPTTNTLCPFIAGCAELSAGFGYHVPGVAGNSCVSTGKKQYEWHCNGGTVSGYPTDYYCRSEYNDPSCP